MNSNRNKGTRILSLILLISLAIFYRNVLIKKDADEPLVAAYSNEKIEASMAELQSINFDLSILNDPKFATLLSIERLLPSIPVGRPNPFAAVLGR